MALAVFTTTSTLRASDATVAVDSGKTVITLKVLTCESCAKKVAAQLKEVAGVSDVKMDVKSKTASVVAKSNATPSPKKLWEAVEKAGKVPVKLAGPSGTFMAKPKQ